MSAGQETALNRNQSFVRAGQERGPSLYSRMKATQESLLRQDETRKQLEAEERTRRTAQETAAAKVAQVISTNTDGSLELALSDAQALSRVQNVARVKWAPTCWVTIERVGSEWQCVGSAPWGAGQPEEP